MSTNTILRIKNLKKEYSGNALNYMLLDEISFELNEKSFSSILAPQYSKKSLLLKIIAGLDEPTSGAIDGLKNKIVYIPSQPSSFPWLNVKRNIELGIRYNKSGKKGQIQELIDLVGLHGYEEHIPHNKSLGFRLRIVLARALASDPKLLLLDEPFSHMENTTKLEMYVLLRHIFIQTGISVLIATSNISEAVFLSDRIIVLNPHTSGIICDTIISLPEPRSAGLFTSRAFKEKVNEIENLVKAGETLTFNSFLI